MTVWTIFGLVLKVTLVLGVGLAIGRALRGRSAALRHAALVATTAAAVALPVLSLALPEWNVPLFDAPVAADSAVVGPHPPSARSAEAPLATGVTIASPAVDERVQDRPLSSGPSMLPRGGESRTPWLIALLCAWSVGTVFVLARFALDVHRTRRLLGEAVETPQGRHARAAARIAAHLGVRRPVRVLFSELLTVPVTWGVLRPVVVLPLAAWEWDEDRIRIVLLHELAHVRRLDCLTSRIAVVASALWWFHPLQWICRRNLRIEQERACDDIVLLDGVGSVDYAAMLVEFARGLSPFEESATARAAIAMARRSTLRDRVETILAAGSRSLRLDARTVGLFAVIAAGLLLPLAAAHLWGETAEARRKAELIAELKSADSDTREAAAWALATLGDEEAVEPLIARLADPVPHVRGVAARSLGKIGGAGALEPLLPLLDDPDPFVRELAILGLQEVPAEGVAKALVAMLDDPEMGVRSVAVSALGQMESEAAVQALARVAESDPDPHTRGMAVSGLGKAAAGEPIAVAALVRLLDDEELAIRKKSAQALRWVADVRAVPGLVDRLGREADPEVREGIIQALSEFAADDRAVDGLLAGMRDPHWGVRGASAAALADSDDPRAAMALVSGLRDPVHQVRLESAWSLDRIEARR